MKPQTLGESNMMQAAAKHFIECVKNTRGNRCLYWRNGRFEHHAQYSAGYMMAERTGKLVGTYNHKATLNDVLADMRCEMGVER